ncbi:LCP family protein [Actinospica sp. MGRD01-02]|uniref:LCP family protein n=1 Tax=Actinospica acidithermotolerans TaxID=2828514 RepID=A0A941ILF8_9ACTN|nr:LCP family protein [Actinospica acidithermotolerans]MBR7829018.1 LCP family protein [Actinospica acidithermotolerans]
MTPNRRPRPSQTGSRAPSPLARLRLPRGLRIGLRALSGTLAVIILATAATGWYMDRTILGTLTTSDALDGLGDHPETDQNILLMGLDSRKDMNGNDLPADILDKLHAGSSSDIGGYNTNTLILLHVPADGSRAVALSIPRDDYVDLPEGLGQHKIKEAYGRAKALAEQQAQQNGVTGQAQLETVGREAGRKAAVEAVQDLLGVQVDHFAEINLAGFYDLANALGGVTVCLKQPAHDDYSGANFPAGVQTLDGQQALEFVRQRHNLSGGDLDRTHRQQAFLASAAAKLESDGVFGSLSKLSALLDVAHRDVVVDAGFNPLTFIRQAGALTSGRVSFYTLPIEGFATEDGESVNIIDPAKVRTDAQELIAGKVPAGLSSGTGAIPQVPQGAATESDSGDSQAVTEVGAGQTGAATSHGKTAAKTAAAKTAMPAAASTAPAPVDLNPPPGVPCVD